MTTDHKTAPFDADRRRAIQFTRRYLLGGTAIAILALSAPVAALAQPVSEQGEHAFYVFSVALTGRRDISPATSKRMYDLLQLDGEIGPQRLSALVALADTHQTPQGLKAAASTAGLDAELMRVLTSWYTGTVDTAGGPVVVAYKEALMYRPVEDGLVVPTYCNKGPMWWRDTLPPDVTRMPINNPKVL